MLRMAHRLLAEKSCPEIVGELLRQATFVNADDIARYVKNENQREPDADLYKHIPNIRLPLEPLFVDFCVPDVSPLSQFGALLCSLSPDKYQDSPAAIREHLDSAINKAAAASGDCFWFYLYHFSHGMTYAMCDGLLSHGKMGDIESFVPRIPARCKHISELHAIMALIPPLMAVSFMHCKNVAIKDRPEDSPPLKWLRRQRAPEVRYHVLDIEPMKQVLRTEGQIEETGLRKALHICRGHFATYTEEKPLFGKVAGTFWVPQCIKGNHKHGTVVKDYSITT